MQALLDLELELKSAFERHLRSKQGNTPPNLEESMRYSLLAPGKRIRPRLALASARAIGLPVEAALPAALAIEMIHCFTLIHDDLPCMDDDDFRRGRPSNHKVFGEGIALLAGDALMALAMDVFLEASAKVPAERFFEALKRFQWAIGPRGVMGGQAAESLLTPESPIEALYEMHRLKTGALFISSVLIPADLAGVAPESSLGKALDSFAAELGLAFQIADDLEDGEEAADATSILSHLSASEARQMMVTRLTRASANLKKDAGETAASTLTAFADEIVRKLQETA